MNKLLIIGISLGYLFLLFALAYRVERARRRGKSYVNNSWVYALSLAVYCTAWTYYGSVGRATTSGIEFITIYLGPSVMCALFLPVLVKMVRICRTQRINTIADFISTRYGKNFSLGVIVTLFCVLGIIPYISLQLKAISNSFHVVTGGVAPGFLPFWRDDSFYIAVIISVFIILFGTRSVDASERHEGLVGAVAFETIVKLVAFVAAGIFVTYGLFDGFGPLLRTAREKGLQDFFVLRSDHAYGNWLAMIVVSMLSLVLLPRQFQVAVVENTNEEHIRKAAWLFPLYLFIINLFVLPIAIGGKLTLGNAADADTYVLSLPLQAGQHLLSVFVYIGGLSAASSMIIVETIALATMVSNHFVLPGFLATTLRGKTEYTISKQILFSRRASIVVILWLAYLYNCYIASYFSLVSIGLVSMAAVAQFAPSVIGALYWKDASRKGAIVGIVAGFAVWAYTLIVPSATDAGLIDQSILQGPFGISWLRPQALFGLDDFDLLAHSVFWSLLVNSFCFAIVSVYSKQSAQEIFQAKVFVDIMNSGPDEEKRSVWKGRASMTDVRTLLSNFLGTDRAQRLLTSYQLRHRLNEQAANADPVVVSFAEKILSGVIDSASARFMVSSITKEEEINIDEVLDIVRESQRVLELNKELKKKSIELIRATDMLTHANEQLKKMDTLKDEFLYTVTHELRTPLTSIRALSEIVLDNPDMETSQRQVYLDNIVNETQRLSYLITQVLNLERYESGRHKLHFSAVDMGQLIQEVLDSLMPLAQAKNARVTFSGSDSMLLLQCDKDLIRQVVYNLVSNAIKYVPDHGGEILATAFAEYGELKVWVEDNGKGIPRELLELVFDKFFQAHNQTLKKPEGTGLGLAICKRIIEMHEGKIWAESKPGPGVKFVFTLPLDRG